MTRFHNQNWQTKARDTSKVGAYKFQCQRCGAAGDVVRKAELLREGVDLDGMPEFNYDLRETVQSDMLRHRSEGWADEKREWFRQYNQYLDSPEWHWRRRLVMERSAGLCEGCRSRPAVHVHHLTYERVRRELLFDLVAVCRECHEIAHTDATGAAVSEQQ